MNSSYKQTYAEIWRGLKNFLKISAVLILGVVSFIVLGILMMKLWF